MKKVLIMVLLGVLGVFIFANTLVIKGSNTILPITQAWVEEFAKMYPNVKVTLEGAGSSTGIAALFNGTTDIANSSRWFKDNEVKQMNSSGKWFAPILIGYDGIAIVVNKNINISNITIEQLKDIYTGKVTRWNQIDPRLPNAEIQVFSRNTASGTFEVFNEKVLKGERMSPRVRMLESSMAEEEVVASTPNSIAYFGIAYVTDKVKILTVNGVAPSKRNILSGKYPLARPLFMFIDITKGWPKEGSIIANFLELAFSKRGQELVESVGYIAAYGQ